MVDTVLYTAKDIQKIFSCGENLAYAIMNSEHFPAFKINKRIYVHKEKFEKWLDANKNNDLVIKY